MNIVKLYLAEGFDTGILLSHDEKGFTLQDNEYGVNKRFYPVHAVQKMEYKENWND